MRTKLLEVPRCNPLKDKDIVSYRSSCPPCRRFRSFPCISDLRICVVRRVGGLEGVGGITCESSAIDEETEAR